VDHPERGLASDTEKGQSSEGGSVSVEEGGTGYLPGARVSLTKKQFWLVLLG
jgi:hypothetical protein